MKVSVLGAGAIGSMLGGLLQHHQPEVEVVLIGRGEHGQAVARTGRLRLDGPWGTRSVAVRMTDDVAALAGSDFVLLTVKSHAADAALRAARDYLGEALVVAIQNGVNDEILLRHVPPERLVVGMTAMNVAVFEPGRASLQFGGVTVLGAPLGPPGDAARRAVALLASTGLRTETGDDMHGVRYSKLTMNALGYASCISGSNFVTEALLWKPWRQTVAIPLVEECLNTYRRAAIVPASIAGLPHPFMLRKLLGRLDTLLLGRAIALAMRAIYNRKPIVFSLHQDLLSGRTTEVDFINGAIVRLARTHGGDAPRNARVVELVHRLEALGPRSFLTRQEVVDSFRDLESQSLLA